MKENALSYLIGKSNKGSSEWLSLHMHLKDTAGIMEYLVDNFISKSFCDSCGIDKEKFNPTAKFSAGVHDIGKATIGYQYKSRQNSPERRQALEHFGLKMPESIDSDYLHKSPHALAGEEILLFNGVNKTISSIIGAHHGIPAEAGEINEQNLSQTKKNIIGYRNYYGDDAENKKILEDVWKKIIKDALDYAEFNSLEDLPELSEHAQMLLSGLLIIADWIASNINYFPLISIDEDKQTEDPYPQRIESAWNKIKFPNMWSPTNTTYTNTEFKNKFGFFPNEIQSKVLDIAVKTKKPGIFILEAPMGCGKTEAALSLSELLAAKLSKNGLFFGLPTQATANGIFPRVQNWAEKQSLDDYHSIQLRHGNSHLNKSFAKIQKGIPDGEDEVNDSGLINHPWFCDSKKSCLADFVVATVDQMLMMALKRKFVMLLHVGLSKKVVVIDEVHAYDTYMNEYLERALQWLGKYGTPVILLSATLPTKRRMDLIKAYLNTKNSDKCFEENLAYPLVTWTDEKNIHQESPKYSDEHKEIAIQKINNEKVIAIIKKAVEAGGCIGVIMNTVKRAQNMTAKVNENITNNVILYHAQFTMSDRAKKENELLNRIGKDSTFETRKGLVIIGTQVLEQSLDIDFDLLVTDICPMDLLLQRIGRLHRHKRTKRPGELNSPVCYVITDVYDNDEMGSKQIYGEWLLKTTSNNLPEIVTLPDDISHLVQNIYNAFDESKEYKDFKLNNDLAQSRANAFLLREPDQDGNDTIHGMLSRSVDDCSAEASVRDGIHSIEVLVMQKHADNSINFIDGTPLSTELSEDEFLRIAEQKLRLPRFFCQKWNIKRTIKEIEGQCKGYISAWKKSYLLCGQFVLFLDENLESKLCGYKLNYSFENGLKYEKECDENEGN